jgi:hypothetical protein
MKFYNYLNEDLHTDYLETSACVGIYMDNSTIKKIDSFVSNGIDSEDIKKSILNILNTNQDWNPAGKKEVIKSLDDTNKYLEILGLIKGMHNFVKDIVTFNQKHLIHDKINDYYKLEKKYLGASKQNKANTADCLISNVSLKELFDTIKRIPVKDDNQNYVEFENGVKYYQLSLKKGKHLAQLGKVTKKLKTLGFDTSAKLNEGKITDFIKNVSSKLYSKIKQTLSGLKKKFNSLFKSKIEKQDIDEILNWYGLKEKKMSDVSLAKTIYENPDLILGKINEKIELLRKSGISLKHEKLTRISNKKYPETSYKLVSNYKTVKLLNDLSGIEDFNRVIREIIADMFFGNTKLPLFKVYGSFDNTQSYEYLGRIDHFIEGSFDNKVETVAVKIVNQNSYYTITVYMLETVDEKGKHYVVLRTGTNSSSKFTFIVEGTKIVTIPLEENIV